MDDVFFGAKIRNGFVFFTDMNIEMMDG